MQPKSFELRQDENQPRVLHSGNFMVHHRHVQNGERYRRSGCQVCSGGLNALYQTPEVKPPEPKLPDGSGIDEEGPSSFSWNSGWPDDDSRGLSDGGMG